MVKKRNRTHSSRNTKRPGAQAAGEGGTRWAEEGGRSLGAHAKEFALDPEGPWELSS